MRTGPWTRAWLAILALGSVAGAQTAELTKLVASDGTAGDALGESVALDGDRALVGASGHASAAGAAYVFERLADGSWLEAAVLVGSDTVGQDRLGTDVSLSGERALVGAPFDRVPGPTPLSPTILSGSAYIFERQPDGTWSEAAKLLASDGWDVDNFGDSLSLSGERALVGSPLDDDRGAASGSAYVFERGAGGVWVEVQKLLASDGAISDTFAYSLSLQGDRGLIGARQDDDLGTNSGSVYVFERSSSGAWVEVQKLLASDGGAGDRFGNSVALDGGLALVGAPNEDDIGMDTGAVYVFELGTTGTWNEVQKFKADDAEEGGVFGWSVSISGDRALIGSHTDDTLGTLSGSAYAFERRASGDWIQRAKLYASDQEPDDTFGRDVAVSGDRALIGSAQDDAPGLNSGSAVLVDLAPLSSAVTQISLSSGGMQPLELDAGHLHAGEAFVLLGSLSGTSPGIPLTGGLVLPLNPDRYFVRTLELPNRPPLSGARGSLNAFGHADAAFTLAPLDFAIAGITVHHAFVTLGSVAAATSSGSFPAPAPALATFVSNPFPLVLVP